MNIQLLKYFVFILSFYIKDFTLQIPMKCDPTRQLYIQVTPVTIKSRNIARHYIHPYEIYTQEKGVIINQQNNSLYFPIDKSEFSKGEKR